MLYYLNTMMLVDMLPSSYYIPPSKLLLSIVELVSWSMARMVIVCPKNAMSEYRKLVIPWYLQTRAWLSLFALTFRALGKITLRQRLLVNSHESIDLSFPSEEAVMSSQKTSARYEAETSERVTVQSPITLRMRRHRTKSKFRKLV